MSFFFASDLSFPAFPHAAVIFFSLTFDGLTHALAETLTDELQFKNIRVTFKLSWHHFCFVAHFKNTKIGTYALFATPMAIVVSI